MATTRLDQLSDVRVRASEATLIESLHAYQYSEGMRATVEYLQQDMERIQNKLTVCNDEDFRRLQGEFAADKRLLMAITKGLTKFQE